MTSKKSYKLALFLLSAGLASFVLFKIIGSSLDEQGILHEPFFLVPIGYLLVGLGCLILIKNLFFKIKSFCNRNSLPP